MPTNTGHAPTRTADTVYAHLMFALSGNAQLSGHGDGAIHLARIYRETFINPEFESALRLVSETLMGLFPEEH